MLRTPRLCLLLLLSVSAGLLLQSCSNDLQDVYDMSQLEAAPVLTADSLRLFYTENGKLTAEVRTPYMLSYSKQDVDYDEFPQGIVVYSYDGQKHVKSMITANYAIYQRAIKLWDARYNVLAVNEAGDSIQSEQIFWNELTARVYTTANVRVTTKSSTLFGRGFESDDRFEHWVIKEPTGVILMQHSTAQADQSATAMPSPPLQQAPTPLTAPTTLQPNVRDRQ